MCDGVFGFRMGREQEETNRCFHKHDLPSSLVSFVTERTQRQGETFGFAQRVQEKDAFVANEVSTERISMVNFCFTILFYLFKVDYIIVFVSTSFRCEWNGERFGCLRIR